MNLFPEWKNHNSGWNSHQGPVMKQLHWCCQKLLQHNLKHELRKHCALVWYKQDAVWVWDAATYEQSNQHTLAGSNPMSRSIGLKLLGFHSISSVLSSCFKISTSWRSVGDTASKSENFSSLLNRFSQDFEPSTFCKILRNTCDNQWHVKYIQKLLFPLGVVCSLQLSGDSPSILPRIVCEPVQWNQSPWKFKEYINGIIICWAYTYLAAQYLEKVPQSLSNLDIQWITRSQPKRSYVCGHGRFWKWDIQRMQIIFQGIIEICFFAMICKIFKKMCIL